MDSAQRLDPLRAAFDSCGTSQEPALALEPCRGTRVCDIHRVLAADPAWPLRVARAILRQSGPRLGSDGDHRRATPCLDQCRQNRGRARSALEGTEWRTSAAPP